MVAYTATFSRGETKSIARSAREYRAAWLVEVRDTTGEAADFIRMGFARDHGMASAAANREFVSMNSVRRWARDTVRLQRFELLRTEIVSVEPK